MIRSLHVYTKSQGAKQTHQFKGCANKYYNIITDKTAQNNLKLDFQKKIEVRVKQVKQHLFRLGDNVKILSQILLTAMYMHLSNNKTFPSKTGFKTKARKLCRTPPGNNFIQMLCICYFTLPCNTFIIGICRPLFTRQLHVVCLRAMCLDEHPGFLVRSTLIYRIDHVPEVF